MALVLQQRLPFKNISVCDGGEWWRALRGSLTTKQTLLLGSGRGQTGSGSQHSLVKGAGDGDSNWASANPAPQEVGRETILGPL